MVVSQIKDNIKHAKLKVRKFVAIVCVFPNHPVPTPYSDIWIRKSRSWGFWYVHIFLVRWYCQGFLLGPSIPSYAQQVNSKGLLSPSSSVHTHQNKPFDFAQGNQGFCCHSVLTFLNPLTGASSHSDSWWDRLWTMSWQAPTSIRLLGPVTLSLASQTPTWH